MLTLKHYHLPISLCRSNKFCSYSETPSLTYTGVLSCFSEELKFAYTGAIDVVLIPKHFHLPNRGKKCGAYTEANKFALISFDYHLSKPIQ